MKDNVALFIKDKDIDRATIPMRLLFEVRNGFVIVVFEMIGGHINEML